MMFIRRKCVRALGLPQVVVCCMFTGFIGTLCYGFGQGPVPRVDGPYRVSPREIPEGSASTRIEVSGFEFTAESTIRFNGRDLPTDRSRVEENPRSLSLLSAMIPESYLTQPGSFQVVVFNPPPGGGISEPVVVQVKPRLQPAKLEIELFPSSVRKGAQVEVTVRLTNLGRESFYVPKRITPFTGGNMLNSYHFEVKRSGGVVFINPIRTFVDGFWPFKTGEEFVRAGLIVEVVPGQTYAGKAMFNVDELGAANEYSLRMRFYPQFPMGFRDFKTKFMTETLLSNVITLTVMNGP